MPKMLGYKLTKAGNRLQIKVEAGKCKLNVTKLQTGSGSAEGDITDLTALVSPEQTVPVNKVNIINQYTARFTAIITNQGLTKDYYLREIGLFAQDPDDGEILYMIGIDEKPDVIPADGYQMLISQEFNIDVVISNVENITVNGKYANLITTEDLNTHNTATDAHANLFKKVLLTEAKTIANTADWNTLTESRTYKISGVTFAADKHQPVGAVGTGELVVLKNGDDTIAQVYYANSAAYDKAGAYHRMCIGGAWTDWVYNITNKGGVVTGDFNINGKLTVDSLDIKNNFTVAGGTPVTGDDLQKVQNQIINPSQTIYVNAITGDDSNDGSSALKAVKTLNKANSLIKSNVNSITIVLNNDTADIEYVFDNNCFISKSNSSITITIQDYNGSIYNGKKPIIKLDFVRISTSAPNQYKVGYFLCSGFENVSIIGVKIRYPEDATINTSKYARQMILFCSILVLNAATDIELIANAILTAPKISKACSISGDSFKILGQDTCYLAQANVPITTINPEAETEDDWNYWIGTEQAVYFNISQSRSSITGLNEAKVTSDCHVLYSNIIT